MPKRLSAVLIAIVFTAFVFGCGKPAPPSASTLHNAAIFDSDSIPRLIREGRSVDEYDSDGCTALWAAARDPNLKSVQLLLEAGADPNARGQRDWTPLHCVAFCWSGEEHTAVAELLLAGGADVNAVEQEHGETALHYAVRAGKSPELVRKLIAHGADIDAQTTPDGETALQFAVSARSHELVELFLKEGASASIQNRVGFVPRQQAPEDELIQALFDNYAKSSQAE